MRDSDQAVSDHGAPARIDRRTQAGDITRERIMRVAEDMFSRRGRDGVSVRDIASAAEIDLALINYHFSSKEGLYRQVFARRAASLNERRLAELDQILSRSRRPSLAAVIRALVSPNVQLRIDPELGGVPFARLIVREMIEADATERGVIKENFEHVAQRFIAAIGLAMPNVPRQDVIWAFNFALGTIVLAMASTGWLETLLGLRRSADPEEILARIVPFIVAGMRAGPIDRKRAKKKGIAKGG